MVLTHPVTPATARPSRWPRWTLGALFALIAANAVYGGIGLMRNGMGMPDDWLARTPFDSWALPGVALLVTVALPQAVGLWLVARNHPRAALGSAVLGAALIGWILVQALVLRRYFFLQPVIAGLGAAELLVALAWVRRTAR